MVQLKICYASLFVISQVGRAIILSEQNQDALQDRPKHSLFKKKANWIFYGVCASLIAIIVAGVVDLALGYELHQIKIARLPDMCLACFAVAANLRGILEGDGGELSEKQSYIFDKISLISMLLGLSVYSTIYKLVEMVSPENSNYILVGCVMIIVVNAYIGWRIENNNSTN